MPIIKTPHGNYFEALRPGHNFEFIGRTRLFVAISAVFLFVSIAMLPVNHFVRGAALNYSIEFRGGTEMTVEFNRPEEPAQIRAALAAGGFHDAEVVKVSGPTIDKDSEQNAYILRFGAVSALSKEAEQSLDKAFHDKFGEDLGRFELSDGHDKISLRFEKDVSKDDIDAVMKAQHATYTNLTRYGRAEDNTWELVLISLNTRIQGVLDGQLGQGTVKAILGSDSVGPKAGEELRIGGIKATAAAILFILIYIAIRFDFRYGPGTVVALVHDAILVIGAFAITYKEFSLTTVAAILTVIGYSMNDTIVVFDRIRENTARLRNKRFDRVVNQSINETLSRTILTSLSVFLVTLCMNVIGTGSIRDFAFAMNVGVVVGTYSSIFIASPVLIWLNDRYRKAPAAKPANATR